MATLQEDIQKLYAEHQAIKKSEARLQEISPEIEKLRKDLAVLDQAVQKEYEDVQNLEKLGLKTFFYNVLGDKESQLEKERQEYLQASLKYDQVRKSLEVLEFESNILQKKVNNKAAIEAQLDDLSKKQEQQLLALSGDAAIQLRSILSQIEAQQRLKIDINEAMAAGTKALESIDGVVSCLQQAHNWGQWDVSGRNPMSNHLKYSAIDKAKDWAYQANNDLRNFEKELQDVYRSIPEDFHLQIDSFNRFIDVFFDNLITDWIIQQKIYNALNNTINTRDKVVRMVKTLETEIPKSNQAMLDLEEQKKQFVLSSVK